MRANGKWYCRKIDNFWWVTSPLGVSVHTTWQVAFEWSTHEHRRWAFWRARPRG